MNFIKDHIEKILGGIFTVSSVFIYFFASDEGTRLLLKLCHKDFSSESIAAFQSEWVWWFFLGYGINALFLILAKIWTQRRISDLETLIKEKDEILKEQKEKLTNYALLRQNIDLIFGEHLKSIARSLAFTHNERISLYIIDNGEFVCCSRFSQNPNYEKRGRTSYPLNEGVIGEAWSTGVEFIASLPDVKRGQDTYIKRTKTKYNIPESTVAKFSMFPRLILGYRISNHDHSDHNAVIIVESTNKNFKTQGNILTVLERNRNCLYELIKDFRDFIPALARARKEDM